MAVKSQATCLLSRLGHLGSSVREAAERRNLSLRREATLRQEARAFYQAHIRGRGGERWGDIIH